MTSKRRAGKAAKASVAKREDDYRHPEAEVALRPEVGTQANFRKKKPPATYRYDSSLSPALDWDGQNSSRELGEQLLAMLDSSAEGATGHFANMAVQIEERAREVRARGDSATATILDDAANCFRSANELNIAELRATIDKLRRLSRPFLNWTGKAERLSFDVPTLPLFVHERLSTKAIIETLKSHEKRAAQSDMFGLFGDPKRSVADQVLRAYEYRDKWVNRLILGDSLVVMNSLLHYEGMGGQVQMIYIDPPYGVKFGSNFQPFVRKRDVSHNDDDDMTREPEMVKAYRDTWELGLHSYLTYLRDRFLLARELLHPSGSVFVQISDENLHHVRELLDEVFGANAFCAVIPFRKTSGAGNPSGLTAIGSVCDYLLWYARDTERLKYQQLYVSSESGRAFDQTFTWLEEKNGIRRPMTSAEREGRVPIEGRRFARADLSAQNDNQMYPFEFEGVTYKPKTRGWRTTKEGMQRLATAKRLIVSGNTLRFIQYADDFPVSPLQAMWNDTGTGSFLDDKLYVVQTADKVVERCVQMTTQPGDLVLDPTCGSGTSAYLAERLGRRWITVDASRVPLALARQRILTATYPYFELKEEGRGPVSGFVYRRRKNTAGEEVGGIIPHVTLKCLAHDEPPQEEVLVDRPETIDNIVRVSGPFAVEATIPSPIDIDDAEKVESNSEQQGHASYLERMLEILRKSPVLQVGGGKNVTLKNIRPPAKSLALSAEAMVDTNGNDKRGALQAAIDAAHEANTGGLRFSQRPVAIVFGPENGAVSEKLVLESAREAYAKSYSHLYVIGFAIQANARALVETSEAANGIPATYIQATPDVMMGDLLKTTRASQIFSVCGMPEIAIKKHKPEKAGGLPRYQVTLLGFDVFDPATMDVEHRKGEDVPAWLLDTDYNGLVFHGSQVFFPRTAAWDSLKKALKATHDETVWDHLAGTVSAPFEAGEHASIAVKVIDDRGNELLVVKNLKDEAK